MKAKSPHVAMLATAFLVLGALGLTGCASKEINGALFANKPPSVELTNAPVAPDRSNPYFYAYRVNWSGEDPDGRVDHYEYAIDPPNVVVYDTTKCNNGDTCWVSTQRNEEIVFFRASVPDSIRGTEPPTASDYHVFVIKAVDDDGAASARKSRAFFAYTIAPTVLIRNPLPSALLRAQVTPSVRIEWEGSDPDGQFTQKPVKYKYKMLDLDALSSQVFLVNPDSLREQEAATAWAGWDSTTADTQFVQFTNLTPGKSYLFVVIGFDEAGAYSPIFSLYSNCLQLTAGFASSNGPRIHIFNQFIDFTYQSGGYSTDPLREIPIEIPTKVNIEVNWDAIPSPGSRIQYFRWMVDGNINDETPRSDELLDYIHWSQPSPTMPDRVVLRPFLDGDHRFYLECADNNTQKSLGILKMTAVTPSFDKPLLVVNDTRLEVDKFARLGGPLLNYTLPWPSKTELDTFFFARGGFNWRETREPATGVISTPGVFAGYPYDTLGTRLGYENPARGVLLSLIGQYKNLIWMLDERGAGNNEGFDQSIRPVTALYAMSGPGRASTLAAYTQLGGRVWLLGGGVAYATLVLFDKRANNQGQTTVFSSAAQFGELAPSRIMYDGAHWRSSVAVTKALIRTKRYDNTVKTRRGDGTEHDTTYIVAPAWSHYFRYTNNTLSSPQYSKLPVEMRPKTAIPDPLPPTRFPSQAGLFYGSSYPCEYILENNSILEDVNPDPEVVREASVLDTLYMASGIVLLTSPLPGETTPRPAPTMTYYHGNQAHRFVHTGFAPWNYARQDCIGLVDFVLKDLWGLPRDESIDRGTFAPAFNRSGGSSPTRSVSPARRTANAVVSTGTTRE